MTRTGKKAAREYCFDVGDRVQETIRGSVGTVVEATPHGVTVQLDAELDTVRKPVEVLRHIEVTPGCGLCLDCRTARCARQGA